MEERRLLLAVALSLLVLTAYSLLFAPAPPPPALLASPSPPPATAPSPSSPAPLTASGPAPAEAVTPAPVVADERERRVEVVAPEYSLAFTNRGARLVSWTLAHHLDERGRPEEMVPAQHEAVRPLDVETGDATLDARLRDALFRPSADTVAVGDGEPSTLAFTFADGRVEAEKTITFRARGLVALAASVKRDGQALPCRLVWGPGLGNPTADERSVRGYQEPFGVALGARGVQQFPTAKLPPEGQPLEAVRWVGIESQYFAALFVAPGGASSASIRPVTLKSPAEEKPFMEAVVSIASTPGEPVQLFVGAKDYQSMAKLGHDLQRVVPVGDWIGPIVVALMRLLRWVQTHVGNWGWSIVVLTVLINVAMAPLRHYSIVNGLKMAKLSPEMKAIQERYRKVPLMDPRRQEMQAEIGALYAKHGMSMGSQMMVGCLPMLLIMPFLFAFYRVLSVSVELRGAPFLWIPDLARHDPLYLTPVLMGVSMFVMQKMTPSTMDPAQQRIMMLMPLMLSAMFLWAPAGLNLYWLTSNLWSILQQGVSMKLLHPGLAPAREKRGK